MMKLDHPYKNHTLCTEEDHVVLRNEDGEVEYTSHHIPNVDQNALEVAKKALLAWMEVGLWFSMGQGSAVNAALAYNGYAGNGFWVPEEDEIHVLQEEGII